MQIYQFRTKAPGFMALAVFRWAMIARGAGANDCNLPPSFSTSKMNSEGCLALVNSVERVWKHNGSEVSKGPHLGVRRNPVCSKHGQQMLRILERVEKIEVCLCNKWHLLNNSDLPRALEWEACPRSSCGLLYDFKSVSLIRDSGGSRALAPMAELRFSPFYHPGNSWPENRGVSRLGCGSARGINATGLVL